MGVKNLWEIIESCKKTLPLTYLQNKRVCIDLSCWVVQLHNVNKSYCAHKEKVYLRTLFHRLRALIALNCTLIFVTDGSIPAIKLATYRKRLNSGSEVAQTEADLQRVTSLQRNAGSEFSCMVKEAKAIGLALGIPCLDSIEEAEAQCALLNAESLCDGCFSADSDIFLFGARTVYRDIVLGDGEGGHVVCYEMADIEKNLGYGRNSLSNTVQHPLYFLHLRHPFDFVSSLDEWKYIPRVDLALSLLVTFADSKHVSITIALLLGGDYSHGVKGLGLESACRIVKSVGESTILQRITSEDFSLIKKTKASKKRGQALKPDKAKHLDHEVNITGNGQNSTKEHPFLRVIDAYLQPKCHSADSPPVYRVLAQHSFERAKLQHICAKFFEWPPEKTDEYILPKIAERDLHRFANLRSTSSELGLRLPLHEVPVKCPVAGIVKPRKNQGRECFEVSWQGFDGLETSVVPADLIERACPEIITEFKERKALPKKRNNGKTKPKKSENKSSVAEIDEKLQALMLEIEQGDNIVRNAPIYSTTVASENKTVTTNVKQRSQDHFVSSCSMTVTAKSGSWVTKNEVIDLLSPSPKPRRPIISNCKKMSNQQISVIDLSDSEAESSPEHLRKAGELRSFLASIRDDLL
ncbi:hypothetical protein ACFE04_004487 [Oxalis oulophora]